MQRRAFIVAGLSVLLSSPAFSNDSGVIFHFYGAEDCPPCMAFKHRHLEHVQAEGRNLGFTVEDNVINKTADLPKIGVYGSRDKMLRRAADQLAQTYPPIFFVSHNGEVVSVHGPKWQAALEAASTLARN